MISSEGLHDPGGKIRIPVQADTKGQALFSADGQYRVALSRRWGEGPFILWCGMNPSTAGAEVDDPTVRWEVSYTRALGFNAYVKTNVMDYRATHPSQLLLPSIPVRSPRNLPAIRHLAKSSPKVIMVYGALHPSLLHFGKEAIAALRADGHELWCLGRNKNGTPKHPLYLRRDTPLTRYVETAN